MNSVEKVKWICKREGVPIYKLEQACGFSNGYIGQLKKGVIPIDRLKKIAEYFHRDVDFFFPDDDGVQTSGQEDGYYVYGETAKVAQEIFENKDMRILFSAAKDSRPEDLRMAADMLMRFKQTNPDG